VASVVETIASASLACSPGQLSVNLTVARGAGVPPTRYRVRWIGSDRRHRVLARSKRLLGVKTLLAGLSVGFSIYIVWEMTAPFGSSVDTPPAPVSAAVVEPDIALRATPAVYASIGSRNLFSPTRSDTQKVDPAVAAIAAMRLNLFGVVFRRSVHRLSEGSRQQAGVRLPARGFSGRWNHPGDRVEPYRPRAAESAAGGAAPPRSLAAEAEPAVVVASAEGFDTAARPVATDSRTDTVSSATLSTPLAAPPLAARPPVTSFGIAAPAVPPAR